MTERFDKTPDPQQGSDTLKDSLRKEGINVKGDIEVDFDLGLHVSKGDALRRRDKIRKADIILLEGAGWDHEVRDVLQKVSRNTMSHVAAVRQLADRIEGDDFIPELLRIMKKGKVFVHPFDIPNTHPAFLEDFMAGNLIAQLRKMFNRVPRLSFDDAFKAFDLYFRQDAQYHVVRENYAADTFPTLIKQALLEVPALQKKKDNIQVLVIWGSLHTSLEEKVKQRHPELTTSLSVTPMPQIFSLAEEYSRWVAIGMEVPSEVSKGAFYESLSLMLFNCDPQIFNTEAGTYLLRVAVASISTEEWRELYEMMVIQDDLAGAQRKFSEALQAAGLPTGEDTGAVNTLYKEYLKKEQNLVPNWGLKNS